jgi:hypothetical protein
VVDLQTVATTAPNYVPCYVPIQLLAEPAKVCMVRFSQSAKKSIRHSTSKVVFLKP